MKIKELYHRRGIKILTIFDKVNVVASIFRKYNIEVKNRRFKNLEKEGLNIKKNLARS